MEWTQQAEQIWTAVEEVHMGARTQDVAFRVDGRDGSYRVDMKTMSCTPWEAIDSGVGFDSAGEARDFAEYYATAITKAASLHPSNRRVS